MPVSVKTLLWRSAITAAIIVLIVAAFYAEENARGRAAWKRVADEITARGESLNWDDYIPRPIPDDQNFFQAPMMTEWFMRNTNGGSAAILGASNPAPSSEIDSELSASNYIAWAATYASQFDQIRQALKRPSARLNGDYRRPFGSPIENFLNYQEVAGVLAIRARCYLVLNQPDKALEDSTMLYDLAGTVGGDGRAPVLGSAMVRMTYTELWVGTIAVGLDTHAWRESDLATLQKQASEVKALSLLVNAIKTQRARAFRMVDQSLDKFMIYVTHGRTTSDLGCWFIPSGWVDQNKALIASVEKQMIDSVDLTNHTISVFRAKATTSPISGTFRHTTPWNFIAAVSIPNFTTAAELASQTQTWADQAQIACALERYRLAHGTYPADLSDLVPTLISTLPHDIINGKPLNYSRQDDSHFRLYSVGWNESDDGGLIAHDRDGAEDSDNGDWAWHDPPL